MARDFYRAVVEQLALLGFERVQGGKGSHEKWLAPAGGRKLIVPRRLKSRHTGNGILKSAGSRKRL